MPKVLAESLLPAGAFCLPWNSREEFRLLCLLARWATRIAPLVALDKEAVFAYQTGALDQLSPLHAGILLDISGTQKVHGGNQALLNSLSRSFRKRGIMARMAICPNSAAAWALARFGTQTQIIFEQNSRDLGQIIAALPIAALRLPLQTLQSLSQLGLRQVSDILNLPRKKLLSRFGEKLLIELDCLLGSQAQTLNFLHQPEDFSASRSFEIALTKHEAVRIAALDLLKQVCSKLAARGLEAKLFRLELELLTDANRSSLICKNLVLVHASRNIKHLSAVIEPILQSISTLHEQSLSITCITFRALLRAKVIADQSSLSAEYKEQNDKNLSRHLMNHFVARLGSKNVARLFFENSLIPEKSFAYRPVQDSGNSSAAAFKHGVLERPSYLLPSPEPIIALAMLPDQPPSVIRWRGRQLKVIRGIGPERICHEWWHTPLTADPAAANLQQLTARDYFRIQDENGRWLWIFRNSASFEWFMHGIWS